MDNFELRPKLTVLKWVAISVVLALPEDVSFCHSCLTQTDFKCQKKISEVTLRILISPKAEKVNEGLIDIFGNNHHLQYS